MGQDENRHLEFVVADVPVGVPHLQRPSPHEDWSSRRLLLPIVIRTLPATEVEQLRQCKNRCPVGGDLALEKDVFKQAFSYEHENHYL